MFVCLFVFKIHKLKLELYFEKGENMKKAYVIRKVISEKEILFYRTFICFKF